VRRSGIEDDPILVQSIIAQVIGALSQFEIPRSKHMAYDQDRFLFMTDFKRSGVGHEIIVLGVLFSESRQ
jgi:hypothetical protein